MGSRTTTKTTARHRQAVKCNCKRCGLRPFSHKADKSFYAVNLACLDNAEPDELIAAPVAFVDGLHDDFRKPPQETRHL